jgi:hypothetical protein
MRYAGLIEPRLGSRHDGLRGVWISGAAAVGVGGSGGRCANTHPNLMKGKPSARDTGLTVRRAVEAEVLRVAFESAVFRPEPAGQLTRSGFVDRVAVCSLFRRVDPIAVLGALRR